ncbi:MAG: hypothetical protein HC877_24075 [Thioploca sp.]|nr:hypothetical protein [Thioploca sp.]
MIEEQVNVTHQEMLFKLRRRMLDAVKLEVIDEKSKDIYEQTLLQIMNEAERQRIRCLNLSNEYRMKADGARSQAAGFETMISVVYSILNGLVSKAEADEREIEELKDSEEESEELIIRPKKAKKTGNKVK